PLEAFLTWRPAIEAADETAYRRVLADPSFRKRLKDEAALPGVPNRFSNKTWPHLTSMSVERSEHAAPVGRTLGGPAAEAGRAAASRVADRGRLVPGAGADLLLFDPATVARGEKRRVQDLPTGAERLDTPGVGVHGVWVNGVRTVDERGIIADCGRPGRVLRDFPA